MKAILASKSPIICADVLNGEANMLESKNFPKDYVGWVYIYCTKGKPLYKSGTKFYFNLKYEDDKYSWSAGYTGRVVCRFWCDYVIDFEEYFNMPFAIYKSEVKGFGMRISKLEIFDSPKELSEFCSIKSYKKYLLDREKAMKKDSKITYEMLLEDRTLARNGLELTDMAFNMGAYGIKKAPSNYCYVEVE